MRTDVAGYLELVRLMKLAGCHTMFIGLEFINPSSLDEMEKGQSLEDMRQVRVTRRRYSHSRHVAFGFETDNWDTAETTVRFAQEMKLTSVQLLFLTRWQGRSFTTAFVEAGSPHLTGLL